MSEILFPTLRGEDATLTKTPSFKNIIQESVSGKEKRIALRPSPRWTFKKSYATLFDDGSQTDDIHTLVGFFLNRGGNFDDFLLHDKNDNSVDNQVFGIGDGITKDFQLVRTFGTYIEPILALNGDPQISYMLDNKRYFMANKCTINKYGFVKFDTAPPVGATLFWSGGYYYRVRFLQEEAEYEYFLSNLANMQTIEMISVK